MAFSGAQVTRLGLGGGPRFPYGSFAGKTATPPVFSGTIPDISLTESATSTDYDLSTYFTGATSYSIAPAVETGWTFNTTTGTLTVIPDTVGSFGPYIVTGTNAGGSTPSNSFGVAVALASLPGGSSDPARKYPSPKDVERLRKVYAKAKGIIPKEEEKPKKKLREKPKETIVAPLPDREFTALKPVEIPLLSIPIPEATIRALEYEAIGREIEALEAHIALHKQWDEEEVLLLLMVG